MSTITQLEVGGRFECLDCSTHTLTPSGLAPTRPTPVRALASWLVEGGLPQKVRPFLDSD
jgi:hypothetical protein